MSVSLSAHQSCILPIPQEITEHTLTFCSPSDVAAFARTCRLAHQLIYGPPDQYLWRLLFLRHPFDDPRHAVARVRSRICPPDSDVNPCRFDWRMELQRRVAAERWLRGAGPALEADALYAINAVLEQATPAEPSLQAWEESARGRSHNVAWLSRFLQPAAGESVLQMLSRELSLGHSSPMRQLGGRLRACLALSLDGLGPWLEDPAAPTTPSAQAELDLIRRNSRAFVYTLSNYNLQNKYGPFLPYVPVRNEYPVNWWHVDAIVNVVALNVRDCCKEMMEVDASDPVLARPPMGLDAIRPHTAPRSGKETDGDWAGVTGNWRRFVSFMDYR